MNIFLGHTTACVFWLTSTQEQCDAALPTSAAPSPASVHTAKAAQLMAEGTVFANQILHVDTPQQGLRGSAHVVLHSCRSYPNAYRKVCKDVYVASPELTFAQMASMLSFEELVLLGNELCSSYVRDEYSPTGTAERAPLATPASIKRCLESSSAFHGKKTALKALRYLTPLTASPKEVEWATRFVLRNQYGGYGLPAFKSNYHVPIPKSMRHLTDKTHFKIDFCWPAQKVAIEYDSDLHTGSEKIALDTMRRNFLVAKGFKVIGITRIQNNSEREMDRVAAEVKRALKQRSDIRCKEHLLRKGQLAATCRAWAQMDPAKYFKTDKNCD